MNIQSAAAQLKAPFKKVGHTTVVATEYSTTLFHYNTAIVTIDSTTLEINNGGYNTATTKKFINRALQAVGFNGYLSQRKFDLYLTVMGVERPFIGSQVCLTA